MTSPDLGPQLELDLQFAEVQDKAAHVHELEPETLAAAFETEPTNVCSCVDEGAKDGKVRLAGAGISHPGGAEAVAALLREQGVTEVSSHDHCGAAKSAYYREHGLPVDATVSQTDINAFARAWAEEVAAKAGIRASHQSADELQRPVEYHEAGVVYIVGDVGTQTFKQRTVERLPPGFVVSTAGISVDEVTKTVAFVDGIARSDHGFGERFSSDQPLRYIIVGEVDPQLHAALSARTESDESLVLTTLPLPQKPEVLLSEEAS